MKRLLLISNSVQHGGGWLDHCEAELRQFLGDSIERILFNPFASGDLDGYFRLASERFERMGLGCDSLHEASDPVAAVRSAQAVFTGGGNTFRLLKALYDRKLVGPLRERALAGIPYAGASAGTNIACVTIKTTNDMPIVWPPSLDALALVPFNINPHYLDPDPDSKHRGETREERIREFHQENEPPVVGLREGAMLRVEGETVRLQGLAGARIFIKGQPPRECAAGERLDWLMG